MKRLSVGQIVTVTAFLLAYTAVSIFGQKGLLLTAISDITGTALCVVAIAAMSWAGVTNQGRTRWFWILLATGAAMVCANLGGWLYYEVLAARNVPDPFWADIPLFLQPVPIMAAAAMRPESNQEGEKFHLATVNFLVLLLWWVYIYAFLIYPDEYILPNRSSFDTYYNFLFLFEFEALLGILGGLALATQGVWRKIYWQLFGASALYLLAFVWLNGALMRGTYYAGSFYDIPSYASICWFILIALRARTVPREQLASNESDRAGDLPGLLAALAVLSLPLIGLCELFLDPHAGKLLPYRVSVTLIAIVFIGVLVFIRNMILAKQMEVVLLDSKQNLEHLKKAQSQLVQSEKLAGIGQLVAGVTHELNNPLTAVIGYSDLLTEEAVGTARKRLERLGTEARRIKQILENLGSFAQLEGGERCLIDTANLVRDSLMLCEYQLRKCGATAQLNFAPDIPRIVGNEGQLKQVFVNLVGNSVHALGPASDKRILIEGYVQAHKVIIRVSDSGPGFADIDRVFDPFYSTMPVGRGTGLGLSICYGTIRDHGGNISAQNLQPNGAAVTIEFPVKPEAECRQVETPFKITSTGWKTVRLT